MTTPHSAPAPAPKRNLTATLREWHKRAGIAAFVFIIWLASSGILLTRSPDLGFDTQRVGWPWLMSLYGLHNEAPRQGFSGGGHWLVQTNDYTVLDGAPLSASIKSPLGLVVAGKPDKPQLFVAGPDSVILLSPTGERIDELRAPILPVATVRRIGSINGAADTVVIQDFDAYQSRDGGETWSPLATALTNVKWSQTSALPEAERGKLLPYSRPTVLVEQMLIDLHSGRLFGVIGTWVITLVGATALWLAPSGFWMWYRIRKRRQQAQR